MEVVRAVGDVDERRGFAAKLDQVQRHWILNSLNTVDRRTDDEVVEILVRHLDAIQEINVMPMRWPSTQEAASLFQCGAANCRREDDDAVAQLSELPGTAGRSAAIRQLAIVDDVGHFGVGGFQQRRPP
jgi:hypothetical protein